MRSFVFFSILTFFYSTTSGMAACYLSLSGAGKQVAVEFENEAIALVSRYVTPVKATPPEGAPYRACHYQASLRQADGLATLAISGPQLNGLGISKLKGQTGWTQALLLAIFLGQNRSDARARICTDYGELMAEHCKPIEAEVLLFDEFGRPLPDGGQVRDGEAFFLMLRPLTPLYAQIFNRDSRGEVFRIFPNPQVSDQTNPLQPGKVYFFPKNKGDLIFRFDRHKGMEQFYVALSSAPLEDIEISFKEARNDRNKQNQLLRRLELKGKAGTERLGKATAYRHRRSFQAKARHVQGTGSLVIRWALDHH